MGTKEEDLKQRLDITEQLATNQAQLAEMRGTFVAGTTADLRHDAELARALRARAWLAHDPELSLKRDLSDVPDDWPPGVDGDDHVSAFIGEQVGAAAETVFGAPVVAAPAKKSPSEKMLETYLENA